MDEKFSVTEASQFSVKTSGSRLEKLAIASVYLVIGYVTNLMFFFPVGDRYLISVMILSTLICLVYRKSVSTWKVIGLKSLLLPMSLYTSILVLSYLINDGYMSTIRMFLYCSLFVYAASLIRLQARYVGILCAVAALEMLLLILYVCGWQTCSRFGGFTNPIFFGMFSVCMAVFSTYLACALNKQWQRWSLYLSAVVFCAAAALTQTRGVMLAFAPLLLIYAFYLYRHKVFSAKRALLTLTVVALIGGVAGYESGAYKRFLKVDDELAPALSDTANGHAYRSSVGFRVLMWKYAVAVAQEHPLFGAGKERFQQYKKDWIEQGRFPPALVEYLPGAHAHNQYFQEIAMRGLIGLSALCALLIVPAVRSLQVIRARGAEWAGYISLSLVVAFATFNLTEVAMKHPEKIAIFTVLVFVALNLGRDRQIPAGDSA
ncbi:O-antigen ligase family protein [Marinobacterium lacunae]|nr:O-antigen ligase family protein [Marinobacterium lacunae]